MQNLSLFIINESTSIIQAMDIIDKNSHGIVFLCDSGNKLLATLSDGDIRRHILAGKSLMSPASEAARYQFHSLPSDSSHKEVSDLCDKLSINVIPGIDKNGALMTVFFRNDLIEYSVKKIAVPVVIMAGGKGTRLYPYTKILPKPLIPIGDITITEHILNKFIEFGCTNFFMIVNHKKEMIKAYFSEINISEFSLNFFDENEFMGTGGGLSLLRSSISETFFFSNCDILILGNYSEMYEQHKKAGNLLTMVCATKSFSFPYGTVNIGNDGQIQSLVEKPSYSFLTNTGFYIIEPSFFDYVPDGTFIHITDIIQHCIYRGKPIGIYPISDNQWFDMGNHEDMEKMIGKVVPVRVEQI
jgi:dTDP-glucose pyrophosphorylase